MVERRRQKSPEERKTRLDELSRRFNRPVEHDYDEWDNLPFVWPMNEKEIIFHENMDIDLRDYADRLSRDICKVAEDFEDVFIAPEPRKTAVGNQIDPQKNKLIPGETYYLRRI